MPQGLPGCPPVLNGRSPFTSRAHSCVREDAWCILFDCRSRDRVKERVCRSTRASSNAEWAAVYYSGYGIEGYLIPIDAKLEKDTHDSDETLPLSRVLGKVEGARKLRLVILDARRNNPFNARMVRTAALTRSIGRGPAPFETEGGVLVAYAAKHGTTAEDGTGVNGPFA